MGLAQSLAADILMFADNDPRTVIYYRRTAVDTYAAGVSVTGAVREEISQGTMSAAGAVLPQGSAAFHMQASQVGARPNPGDVVSDEGRRYSIDSVQNLAEGTHYRVVGIPEVG